MPSIILALMVLISYKAVIYFSINFSKKKDIKF